jgi:hypothetical protein
VRVQCPRGAAPGEAAQAFQAARQVLVEVALHRAARHVGRRGDLLVGEALALEPQDLHLLLDPGVGMIIAIVTDGVQHRGVKGNGAHGNLLIAAALQLQSRR